MGQSKPMRIQSEKGIDARGIQPLPGRRQFQDLVIQFSLQTHNEGRNRVYCWRNAMTSKSSHASTLIAFRVWFDLHVGKRVVVC